MKATPMDLPTSEAAQWSALEWGLSGIAMLFSIILAWAGRVHFKVERHDEKIAALETKQEGLATKTDMEEIKFNLRLLLKHALGVPHVTEE